jgi:alpha-galactosidase
MPTLKIALLGAGSLYFPEVLEDLAATAGLSGSEVCLYDLDHDKCGLMADLGNRVASREGSGLRVRACEDLAAALDGASFALSSIGASGASAGGIHGTAAHNADRVIPARYGIFQLAGDTGGPAGMMLGLRSIPVHLGIAREMEKRCPHAILLNHSNPMAVLCRAIHKHTSITAIGLCHGVQGGIRRVARLMGVQPGDLEVVWIGTNHYHWFTRICLNGRDIYPEVMERAAAADPPEGEAMSQMLSSIYRHRLTYHDDRHAIEFYPFLAQVRDVTEMPYGFSAKAAERYADLRSDPQPQEPVARDSSLRREHLKRFADQIEAQCSPEDKTSSEDIAGLIDAIATGQRQIRILNIPNDGVVSNLPDYAILEVEAVTDSRGARGIYVGEAPLALMGMLQKRIAWQEAVVEAGVKGDRDLALQALMLDEMAIRPEKATAMLDELLAASRDLLPQFGEGSRRAPTSAPRSR